MNFRNILKEIEKADPEVYQQLSGRRQLLKSFGAKVAVAALPVAIGSLFTTKKAYGKTTDTVISVLNFTLEYAYFQYNFYHTANNTGGLIPSNPANNAIGVNDLAGFQASEANEKAHILFLTSAITALGGTPYTPKYYNAANLNPLYVPAAYDFTMGGTYPVYSNYPTFLNVIQTFQDTYVRVLNSFMPVVIGNTEVLTQLLQIYTVEARQAAHVRIVRRYTGAPENPAPWITNNIAPDTRFQTNYNKEDNLIQLGGINIETLTDKYNNSQYVPKVSATAAFDEPLDSGTVSTFIAQFML